MAVAARLEVFIVFTAPFQSLVFEFRIVNIDTGAEKVKNQLPMFFPEQDASDFNRWSKDDLQLPQKSYIQDKDITSNNVENAFEMLWNVSVIIALSGTGVKKPDTDLLALLLTSTQMHWKSQISIVQKKGETSGL